MHVRNGTRSSVRAAPTSEWENFIKGATDHLWTAYCAINGNYVAIITVLIVVMISLLLPDITHKFHGTELNSMKKILNQMSNEVKQAEVACLTVADEICCLQCNMHDDTTETEVTIMSYLYTDSFDAKKAVTSNQ